MYQWGLEEEELKILSILWAEEEALGCQEDELQEALEDLEADHLPCSPHLKLLSDLLPMSELWEHPHKFLAAIKWKPKTSSISFNDMFESTMMYQDLNP